MQIFSSIRRLIIIIMHLFDIGCMHARRPGKRSRLNCFMPTTFTQIMSHCVTSFTEGNVSSVQYKRLVENGLVSMFLA